MNEHSKLPELDPRLSSAMDFVRPGGVVCDVGTDHAYIPIYAVLSGRCGRAVASDINEGPLARARINGNRWGVSDRIVYCLADGLDGTEPEKNGVTDIVICGMGGELIAKIIDASEHTRKNGVRLILQPMTMAYELRKYLTERGYRILSETLSRSAGKVYTCICAEFTGNPEVYSETELLLGRHNILCGGELFRELAEKEGFRLKKRIGGLKAGGHDAVYEEALLGELENLLEKDAQRGQADL